MLSIDILIKTIEPTYEVECNLTIPYNSFQFNILIISCRQFNYLDFSNEVTKKKDHTIVLKIFERFSTKITIIN